MKLLMPSPESAPGNQKIERQLQHLTEAPFNSLPEWTRAPKKGLERHCGLSRATLYRLSDEGLIKSVSLRKPNAIRGIRLFNLPSILEFIRRHEVTTKGEAK